MSERGEAHEAHTKYIQNAPLVKEAVETEIQISTEMLTMLLLLMLSIFLGHLLKKSKHKYLQEAGLTTLIGMAAGGVLRIINGTDYMKKIQKHFVNMFMLLLLPPIIFESGYNLHTGPMFKNVGSVIMYSFLGTFIAIFSTSTMFYYTAKYSPDSW
jgi:solute carrier family 9 (sodium/hydrogen exchanger), member 8